MNGTISEIRGFASNFAPRNWSFCQGQLLAISSNTALFSLLGTIYGGDGRTTFGLPDLRGRMPIGPGNGPGLTPMALGQRGGGEQTTVGLNQLAQHSHGANFNAVAADGLKRQPTNNFLGGDGSDSLYSQFPADTTLRIDSVTLANAGNSSSINLRNPYQGINMIICMFGIYPSRS